jgi:hypothetical protein
MTQKSSDYKPFVLDRLATNGDAGRLPSGRACGRMFGRGNDVPRGEAMSRSCASRESVAAWSPLPLYDSVDLRI